MCVWKKSKQRFEKGVREKRKASLKERRGRRRCAPERRRRLSSLSLSLSLREGRRRRKSRFARRFAVFFWPPFAVPRAGSMQAAADESTRARQQARRRDRREEMIIGDSGRLFLCLSFLHLFPALFCTDLVPCLEHGVPLRLDVVVLARHGE